MTRRLHGLIRTVQTLLVLACALTAGLAPADDWPEVQGKGRLNVWNETGILRKFPAEGLKVRWRTPIQGGFGGPAVASGRVFVADYEKGQPAGNERVLCLDEKTGRILWTYRNADVAYGKFAYNSGPRCTPTVDGDRVYVQGAAGDLYCLKTSDGTAVWTVNLPTRFQAKIPTWGYSASPLIADGLVIVPVGGQGDAGIVGLNKLTGETVWQSLPASGDVGYSSPILATWAGKRQLIDWQPSGVFGLDPKTGAVNWQCPWDGNPPVATPVVDGDRLLLSSFWTGSILLRNVPGKPQPEMVWRGKSKSEVNTDGLHSLMSTPVLKDGYIYGVCSYGQLRCLRADTGERVWESLEATKEKARWANAFITRNRDVFFLNNDRGELIIADLTPRGYRELSRTQLIKPTSGGAGARELKLVNWTMPAFANRHIIIRNDEEILSASLAN